ncbi:MAG: hypothetical protein VYE22_32850 [Myxococcota bacterium]|nr:hypothetical protein [Myxococcota bacterium]
MPRWLLALGLLAVELLVAAPASAQESTVVPEPPEPVELRPATVRFHADVEGLEVLYLPAPTLDEGLRVRLAPPSRYQLLCAAPCDRELPQTHLGLALRRGERVVRFTEPFGVDGPTGVRLDWIDRGREREAGVAILAAGVPLSIGVGVGVSLVGLTQPEGDAFYAVGASVGAALLGAALVTGLLLLLADDDATFEITPLPDAPDHLRSRDWR